MWWLQVRPSLAVFDTTQRSDGIKEDINKRNKEWCIAGAMFRQVDSSAGNVKHPVASPLYRKSIDVNWCDELLNYLRRRNSSNTTLIEDLETLQNNTTSLDSPDVAYELRLLASCRHYSSSNGTLMATCHRGVETRGTGELAFGIWHGRDYFM